MVRTFSWLAAELEARATSHLVVAVDGRSASGKTTFAATLAKSLGAPIVHTDDVAWHHSFFVWWPLLIDHILLPFQAGQPIFWTPEAWENKGRSGSIAVPISSILIVEGVSASRRELVPYLDFSIWIETNPKVAEERGLQRDGPEGHDFWFEWQNSEIPFLEADKPWERANLIVDGAPTTALSADEFISLKPIQSNT